MYVRISLTHLSHCCASTLEEPSPPPCSQEVKRRRGLAESDPLLGAGVLASKRARLLETLLPLSFSSGFLIKLCYPESITCSRKRPSDRHLALTSPNWQDLLSNSKPLPCKSFNTSHGTKKPATVVRYCGVRTF